MPRDPSIQIIHRLGPEVCKYLQHWAIWISRVSLESGLLTVQYRIWGSGFGPGFRVGVSIRVAGAW